MQKCLLDAGVFVVHDALRGGALVTPGRFGLLIVNSAASRAAGHWSAMQT